MRRGDNFTRRPLISVDAKGYGQGDDQWHLTVQRALPVVLDEAAAAADLKRDLWLRQPGGDGELAILPDSEPEVRVVDDFVRELHAALRHHNQERIESHQLRLRLAIHHGVAIEADNGFAGQGVVVVSRLVECEPLRTALTVSGGCLAVLLSRGVYNDVVAQGHTTVAATEFRRVVVRNKEYHDEAWLYVPGSDVHLLDLKSSDKPEAPAVAAAAPPSAGRRRSAQVVNEFHGSVDASHANFGINRG